MGTSKFIGSVMILIGTTVGAGMLELPMVSAAAGFSLSSVLMILMWGLSIVTALIVLEVNLALPIHSCSFSAMAEQILGSFGKVVTWLSYLFLLYSIAAAYVAGGTSLITSTLNIKSSSFVNALSFTFIMGLPVFFGTKAVDYFNRGLISFKGFFLLVTLVLIIPSINVNNIVVAQSGNQPKYLWVAAPIFFLSFFYHFVIPSLRIYIGDKPRELKWAIIIGTTVSLTIYLLWIIATLGTVPINGENSFASLSQLEHTADAADFVKIITTIISNRWVTASISWFSNVALTTSFLGVTLGLFDFLADGFKMQNTRTGRLKTAGLTFIPPILFATFYPNGFALALYYAAIPVAILALVLPSLMIYRLRINPNLKSQYRMFGGTALFVILFIIGIVFVILPILSNLHLLPTIYN